MEGITLVTEKDIQLLKAIGNTGMITLDLLPYLGITENRLYQHIISGNIVKRGNYIIFGTLRSVYVLSDKAKKMLRSDFQLNPYKSDSSQLEHDYVLSKIYLHLPYECKESYQNETKLKMRYNSPKTTDGMFVSNGEKVCVEVVTDSYSKDMIEAKKEFIIYHADKYIMLHTHKEVDYTI